MNDELQVVISENRQQAAEEVLNRFPQWSDRRIAKLCGLSPTTIRKVRRRSAAALAGARGARLTSDEPAKRIGADGKSYPATTTNQKKMSGLPSCARGKDESEPKIEGHFKPTKESSVQQETNKVPKTPAFASGETWLTMAEVVERWRSSAPTIRAMAARGRIKMIRLLDRSPRIALSSVLAIENETIGDD